MLDGECADVCAVWRFCRFHIPDLGVREWLLLLLTRRPQICAWHVYVLKSLDFGEILDFGLGYFRDRQHVRFMSCKPENTYGWRITISVVGWIRPVLFGFQRHVLCYWNTDFFLDEGKLSCVVFYRKSSIKSLWSKH